MEDVNLEAKIRREQVVLGCLLAFPGKCFDKAVKLRKENFSDRNHQIIYQALQLLNKEGLPVDIINLNDKLTGQIETSYLLNLMEGVISPIASNFDFHLDQLVDKEQITPHDQFLKAMPADGFLSDYLKWIDPITDACAEFKFWPGMETLAIICGRKRCIPNWGIKTIYPNLFTVKIASSGERKSTASYGTKRLVRQVDISLPFYDAFSPEAMWRGLSEKPQRILFNDEFSKLLGEAKKKSFQYGTKQDLVILYDCPPEYRRKLSQEEFCCENPFVCYSACTTMPWFLETIDYTDLRCGFLARFNFILGSPRKKLLPCPPKPDEANESYLVGVLREIYNGDCIEMELSPEAMELYVEWYKNSDKALKREINVEPLAPFYVRLVEEYALKYAILYSVSEIPNGSVITLKHLELAISLIEYLKMCLREMILKDFVFNEATKNKLKILKMIEENISISHSDLLRNSHLRSREFREIIETLVEEERITINTGERGKTYEAISNN